MSENEQVWSCFWCRGKGVTGGGKCYCCHGHRKFTLAYAEQRLNEYYLNPQHDMTVNASEPAKTQRDWLLKILDGKVKPDIVPEPMIVKFADRRGLMEGLALPSDNPQINTLESKLDAAGMLFFSMTKMPGEKVWSYQWTK